MATIKAIEDRSVHQIQSGQVIVDLISVVKELVENSLDAGTTSIEIRFKNQGLDSIEVIDHGKGISPDDFETVALKHYTSKLSSYEDLTSLDTFGFRGEALSSLCALSKFHIITARAEDGAVGKRLEFEISGKLKSTSVVAAQPGTTVSVEDLFCNLPVRRKELEKNIKREYNKVIAHLHAYACISVGVRFAVTNQMPKAKKMTVFSTKLNTTTKENIANVFGAKALLALVKLDLRLGMEPSNGPSTQSGRNWSTQATDRSKEVHVQGYISKPVFGEGRQAPDRQMFFVNSRPCGLPQVSKAVNEVYKSFNVSQVPFVFANLVMDTNAYDVNVSPDKRSIMLHDQTALLDSLKSSLNELFDNTDQSMPQTQLPNRKLPSYQPLAVSRSEMARESTQQESDSEDDEVARPVKTTLPSHSSHQNGNITPANLIESWTERDLEARRESRPAKSAIPKPRTESLKSPNPTHADLAGQDDSKSMAHRDSLGVMLDENREANNTSDESQMDENPAETGIRDAAQEALPNEAQRPDPMGSPYDDLFSQRPVRHVPTPLEQFNALMDRMHPATPDAKTIESDCMESERGVELDEVATSEIATTAPASQKAESGPVQNAFDRMRPKRTPQQTTEVTIGNKTTTTTIGSSPPYKKRRIHQPVNSQSIAAFGGSPLLARGLRSFAARGSQLGLGSSAVSALDRRHQQSSAESVTADNAKEPTPPHDALHDGTAYMYPRRPAKVQQSDPVTSDPLDTLLPSPADDDVYDDDYIDETEKKLQEDEKVARLIQEAEFTAAQPSDENLKRGSQVLKNGNSRKESTLQLAQYVRTTLGDIQRSYTNHGRAPAPNLPDSAHGDRHDNGIVKGEIDDAEAETRLSLTVSKHDFERMHIVGQFNLGFVLALRPRAGEGDEDQLFIIDQHAADEKYNYERLQRTVTLQNQRLVRPKPLDLTAIEEEIILDNAEALKANGFEIETESDLAEGDQAGRRCRLITLPISGEKTFDLSDLEELLHLLSEAPAGSSEIPRPKKVQKMLAMRACRSSIMVGKTLTLKQMRKVVRHMGEMEKPWNCPHGRPTMRHLAGMGSWNGWSEGDPLDPGDAADELHQANGGGVDWSRWLEERR